MTLEAPPDTSGLELLLFIAVNKWQLLCFTSIYLSGAIILHLCISLPFNEVQTILVQLDQD